jgi:hypothetical protein
MPLSRKLQLPQRREAELRRARALIRFSRSSHVGPGPSRTAPAGSIPKLELGDEDVSGYKRHKLGALPHLYFTQQPYGFVFAFEAFAVSTD